MTETAGFPGLSDATSCRHVTAELPGGLVFRQGQQVTVRLVGSCCDLGTAWPDVPVRVESRGLAPGLSSFLLVDEAGGLGDTLGYELTHDRVDAGTSFPIRLLVSTPDAGCVLLPARDPEAEVGTRRQMRELLRMTGWSKRTVSVVLRTSHVTVGKIASEGASARSVDIAERLAAVHACVRRLAPLVADQETLRSALETPSDEGTSALNLLTQGEYARAYRFALGVLAPAPAGPLLQTRPEAARLPATAPIDEPAE